MYNEFRNELYVRLDDILAPELREKVISLIDDVTKQYDVSKKETLPMIVSQCKEVDIYLGCKKIEGLSELTINNYQLHLTNFFTRVNKPLNAITTNDIRLYLVEYQSIKPISNKSLDSIRSCICRFFSWCSNEGYIADNPAKNIPKIKAEKKQREALTREELEYVRQAAQDSIRMTAMLEFMYSTGCRVSEMVNVKISDIDFTTNTVTLFGKGKKFRTSYLNAKCLISLKDYMKVRKGESPYVFCGDRYPYGQLTRHGVEKCFAKYFSETSEKIGKPITPHIIRHTFATLGLLSGCDISVLSKILGHENISTTMIYAEVNNSTVREQHKKYIV